MSTNNTPAATAVNPFVQPTEAQAVANAPTSSAPKMRETYDFFGRRSLRDMSAKGQYTNLFVVYVDIQQADGTISREFLGKVEMRSFVSADTTGEVIGRIFGAHAHYDRVDLRALTPEAKAILNKLDAYGFQPAWNPSTARTALGNAWANGLHEATPTPEPAAATGTAILNDAAEAAAQ